MAITAETLKNWAMGASKEAKPPRSTTAPEGAEPDHSPEEMDDTDDMESEPASEAEKIWAGEIEGDPDEVMTPELADELMGWLAENEPNVHGATMELANAILSGDEDAVASAQEDLGWVEQTTGDDFSEDQRDELSEKLGMLLADAPEPESPEFTMAIAIAIAEARSEQFDETEQEEGEEEAEPEEEGDEEPPEGE